MARNATARESHDPPDGRPLPNLVTLVGRGVPTNFEIAVGGDLDLVGADPLESVIVVSNGVAEGAIDAGTLRFRFSGELSNVRLVDWNGVAAPESPSAPTVRVDYGAR